MIKSKSPKKMTAIEKKFFLKKEITITNKTNINQQ